LLDDSHEPSIGVALCVEKWTPYLRQSIESVLSQDYKKYLFYIVENGNDERAWITISEYNDIRIHSYRTNIKQLAFNLNYLINIMDVDYIIRMDADDVSLPRRFRVLVREIKKNRWPDVIGSWYEKIDEKGKSFGPEEVPTCHKEIVKRLPFFNPFSHPATAIKRRTLLSVGGYAGYLCQDYNLWCKIVRNVRNAHFMNVPEVLFQYRIYEKNDGATCLTRAEGASIRLREFMLTSNVRFLYSVFTGIVFCFKKR